MRNKKLIILLVILIVLIMSIAVYFVYQDFLNYNENYQRQLEQIKENERGILDSLEKLK